MRYPVIEYRRERAAYHTERITHEKAAPQPLHTPVRIRESEALGAPYFDGMTLTVAVANRVRRTASDTALTKRGDGHSEFIVETARMVLDDPSRREFQLQPAMEAYGM